MAKQVLIVENAREYREMLQEIVEGIGYAAHSAQKATDAWKLLQNEIISLILLDIKMPGIHGHQFLRYIRKKGTRIPVIVVSGFLSPEVLEVLKAFDVTQVIVKPFKVMRLAQEVNKVLEAA